VLERGEGNEVELVLPRIFTSKKLDTLIELFKEDNEELSTKDVLKLGRLEVVNDGTSRPELTLLRTLVLVERVEDLIILELSAPEIDDDVARSLELEATKIPCVLSEGTELRRLILDESDGAADETMLDEGNSDNALVLEEATGELELELDTPHVPPIV
jgi:hypothetical protein